MISQPHPTHIWVDYGVPPRQGLVGRPVRRAEAQHVDESELELLLAPSFPLAVHHFPLRSFAQYRHMVELAMANDQLKQGNRVRNAFQAGHLEEIYSDLILDDDTVERGMAEGWLVEDTEFRDYLAACPGMFDGDGRRRSVHAAGPRNGGARSSGSSRSMRCTRSAATSRRTRTSFRRDTWRVTSGAMQSASWSAS